MKNSSWYYFDFEHIIDSGVAGTLFHNSLRIKLETGTVVGLAAGESCMSIGGFVLAKMQKNIIAVVKRGGVTNKNKNKCKET